MTDPSPRPLAEPLTDLPVEAPLDALPPSPREPGAGGRAPVPVSAPQPAEATAEEAAHAEKLLLASEQSPPRPKPAAASPPPAAPPSTTTPSPATPAAATPAAASPPPPRPAAVPEPVVASPSADGAPLAAPRGPELMDRDFIARNQVVERYLSGRLPIRGATDFERFCREHPELLDELGIPERVNAALRLLEAGGKPEPWAEPPKPFWQKLEIVLGLLGATLVLAIALTIVADGSAHKSRRIVSLLQQATERPLEPAASTRDIRLLPSRDGASDTPAIVIGGGSEGQLADFHIDESRSPYRLFRVTIDRIDQGRVGIIDHLAKDSDGNLRIALNDTALGPGNYQLTIEGLDWQGQPQPDSWVTIGVRATQ